MAKLQHLQLEMVRLRVLSNCQIKLMNQPQKLKCTLQVQPTFVIHFLNRWNTLHPCSYFYQILQLLVVAFNCGPLLLLISMMSRLLLFAENVPVPSSLLHRCFSPLNWLNAFVVFVEQPRLGKEFFFVVVGLGEGRKGVLVAPIVRSVRFKKKFKRQIGN